MNLHLKIATLLTLCLSIFFVLIALSSNHWISTDTSTQVEYMGLWKACSRFECVSLGHGGYAKAFLILSFLFGIVCILLVAAVLYIQGDGPTGVLKCVAWSIFAEAVLETIGMINGSIIFGLSTYFRAFSWSFGLGWFAVILAVASAIICGVDHVLEPTPQEPILERIRSRRGGPVRPQIEPQGESKPPPYSPPQGAVQPYLGPQGEIQTYQTPPMAYDNQPRYQPPAGSPGQLAYPTKPGYPPTSVAQ